MNSSSYPLSGLGIKVGMGIRPILFAATGASVKYMPLSPAATTAIFFMFDELRAMFRRLGVDLQKRPGEYTVGYIGPSKPEAFERLEEAVARAEELVAARPSEPAVCGRRRGLRGIRWALKPKALRRRIFRRSNAKYRAWALKNGSKQ